MQLNQKALEAARAASREAGGLYRTGIAEAILAYLQALPVSENVSELVKRTRESLAMSAQPKTLRNCGLNHSATLIETTPELLSALTRLEAEKTEAFRRASELEAERDLLQEILDSRPAINAGLPDTYIRWSQAIYSGGATRAALARSTTTGGE